MYISNDDRYKALNECIWKERESGRKESLQDEGYVVAMHGYQHVYDRQCRGMTNNGYNTEFTGHPYEVQYLKIKNGKMIISDQGISTDVFCSISFL